MSFTPDLPSTEDVLAAVLSSSTPPLPPQESLVGDTTVYWWEHSPGSVVISAEGGTSADREYAQALIGVELGGHGYRRASFDMDNWEDPEEPSPMPYLTTPRPTGPRRASPNPTEPQSREHSMRLAAWPDVMNKSKRLLQSGQVHILRNGFNYIVGHVVGDHGDYETEISRDDPNSRAITSWQCFLPDAPVTLGDGSRVPIAEVVAGDEVLTHLGRIQPVTNAWSRPYSGRMARVKLQGIEEEVIATADHRFWAANDDYYLQDSVGWRGRIKLGEGPLRPDHGWREAQTLTAGQYLSMPQLIEERPCIINGVEIDENLATFLGWYAAEGYIVKSTRNRIGLSMAGEELPIAQHLSAILKERFGTGGTIRATESSGDEYTGTVTDFRISHPALRALVEDAVGTGEAAKRLCAELLVAPLHIQQAFMDAYVEGDGNIDGRRARVHTVSTVLHHQTRVILARLGHATASAITEDNSGQGFVENWRPIHWARWAIGPKRNSARFIRDGQAWLKIEAIEFFDYNGSVHDIEVAEDHSFVVYGVNAHNCSCPWDQYAWQRTRKWKKFEGRPCAHVLALYWKALSTPMDEDISPEQAQAMGTGQKLPAPPVAEHPPEIQKDIQQGEKHQDHLPRSFGPEGIIQGDQLGLGLPPDATGRPGPAQAPMAPPPQGPMPPGILPPFPGAGMEQPWAGPGTTPGGGVSPPGAFTVPGAKPQTPANPLQNPSTYSKVAADFNAPEVVKLKNDVMGLAEGPIKGQYGDGEYREVPAGSTGEVLSQDPSTGWVELLLPLDDSGVHGCYHVRTFVEPSDIEAVSESNAFIRRYR